MYHKVVGRRTLRSELGPLDKPIITVYSFYKDILRLITEGRMSVKHALMALIYQQPMHGYELSKVLPLTLGTERAVRPGQIASTLSRMESAGLIDHEIQAADAAPNRKVYHLTDEGTQALEDWYRTPDVREYQLGDTFYNKLVFSLIDAPVPPEQVITTQRRRLFQELHDVIELRNAADDDAELPLVLLLETVIAHLEADLRWLDLCEERLLDLKRYQPPDPEPQPRGRPRRSSQEE